MSVLAHGSDGGDRSVQLCLVVSLLLDQHDRTLKGFVILIEKDWISFGHKSNHRDGNPDGDPKESPPVTDSTLSVSGSLWNNFPVCLNSVSGF